MFDDCELTEHRFSNEGLIIMPDADSSKWPKPNWAQVVSAICSCIALIGLYGLWRQVDTFNRQEKRESERRIRDAYGKLYPMDMDVWKFVGNNAILTKAFLHDKDGAFVNKMSEGDKGRFDAACQMMGDMFEYYLLIESDLEGDEWAKRNNCWKAYMKIIYQRSAGFREYIRATEPEWTEVFNKRFSDIPLEGKAP